MPTYEYRCDACGHEFEREQRITAQSLKKCPDCGKMKLVRLVGSGNFILKGGGWYADLYSSPSPKDAKKDEQPASTPVDKGAAGDSGGATKSRPVTESPAKPSADKSASKASGSAAKG